MPSPLVTLATIISSGVQALESTYSKHGKQFPSLDDPFIPGSLDEDPAVIETSHLIVAAAAQIIAAVRSPEETIRELAPSMYMSASLGFVVDADVPEILKDAGPQGLHAKDIATKAGADGSNLARILRYLATRHVFREVTPDVFANNKISSAIVKSNKTLAEVQAKPLNKYDDAGTAAFVGHVCDEGLRSCASMPQYLKDPHRHEVAPFNIAFDTKSSLWAWFEQPENDWRLRRFMAVMTRDGKLFKDSVFTTAIDWSGLKANDVVVDVGGNLGTVTLTLAKTFPHLHYVVQDLGRVMPDARKFWEANFPEAIAGGRVALQEHDFFQLQPVKSAAVYFMRFIVHDWANAENEKILKNIRAAASPSSKLILFEFCVPYACPDPGYTETTGATSAPWPLLANLGLGGGAYPTFVDIQMMNLFNGQERTLGGFTELGNATGWKLEAVKLGLLTTFIFSPA